MNCLRWLAAALLPLFLLAGCSAPATAPPEAPAGCVPGTEPAPTSDVPFSHASNVEITGGDGYRVLTVHQPYPCGPAQSVVLLGCAQGEPALPAELADAPVVRTPVNGFFMQSTTPIAM